MPKRDRSVKSQKQFNSPGEFSITGKSGLIKANKANKIELKKIMIYKWGHVHKFQGLTVPRVNI